MDSLQETYVGRGRPTKFQDRFCEIAIELGKEGHSRAKIAAELDIALVNLREWELNYPHFRMAMSRARDLALAWWEEKGRKGVDSRDFNAQAYSLQVRNRFPEAWRDRTIVEHSGIDGGPIEIATPDNIRAELERRGLERAIDIEVVKEVKELPERVKE